MARITVGTWLCKVLNGSRAATRAMSKTCGWRMMQKDPDLSDSCRAEKHHQNKEEYNHIKVKYHRSYQIYYCKHEHSPESISIFNVHVGSKAMFFDALDLENACALWDECRMVIHPQWESFMSINLVKSLWKRIDGHPPSTGELSSNFWAWHVCPMPDELTDRMSKERSDMPDRV